MRKRTKTPDTAQMSLPGFEAERAAAPTRQAVLEELARWSEAGWMRRLDSALAAFVASLSPTASPAVLLATAVLAHLEGQGHSCVSIEAFVVSRGGLLGWEGDAKDALGEALRTLPGAPAEWVSALRSCEVVQADPAAPDRQQPLVLRGDLLYLRRYWRHETQVAAQVLGRVAATTAIDAGLIRSWLDRLFPRTAPAPGQAAGVDWQKVACAIAARGRFSIVTGGPGTGKTYTAARLLALLFAIDPAPQRLRVALAAPTGKAAARLKQSIDDALTSLQPLLADVPALSHLAARIPPARTLHSLLGARPDTRRLQRNAANPLDIDVLIVDEASMVHLEMMAALVDALPSQARVVLLGDKDQLASVEAGSVLGDLCLGAGSAAFDPATRRYLETATGDMLPASTETDHAGPLARQTVMLRDSRRFAGAIGRLAQAVNAGEADRAEALMREGESSGPGRLTWLGDGRSPPATALRRAIGLAVGEQGYRPCCEQIRARPARGEAGHADWVAEVLRRFDRFRILCATREGEAGVEGMNTAVERALVRDGLLNRTGDWYEGRPVIVTRNDSALGVFNGDVGIALRGPGPDAALRVYFSDGAGVRSTLSSRLASVETAFAITVHKSQGSEFAHAMLSLPKGSARAISRELVYTGATRARDAFTLFTEAPDALRVAIGQKSSRGSGLARLIETRSLG